MQNADLLDYIGVESNIDFQPDVDFNTTTVRSSRNRINKSSADKEFPPPIPCLARTGNLPSHMPFVMKRYYSTDGRLIIQEQKVERHEYFQAHRFNGRLVLNLIPLDEEEGFKKEIDDDYVENEIKGGDHVLRNDLTVEKEVFVQQYGSSIRPCGGLGVVVTASTPPLHT